MRTAKPSQSYVQQGLIRAKFGHIEPRCCSTFMRCWAGLAETDPQTSPNRTDLGSHNNFWTTSGQLPSSPGSLGETSPDAWRATVGNFRGYRPGITCSVLGPPPIRTWRRWRLRDSIGVLAPSFKTKPTERPQTDLGKKGKHPTGEGTTTAEGHAAAVGRQNRVGCAPQGPRGGAPPERHDVCKEGGAGKLRQPPRAPRRK